MTDYYEEIADSQEQNDIQESGHSGSEQDGENGGESFNDIVKGSPEPV